MSENSTPLLLPACIFMNSGSTVVQICAMVSITLIFLHRLLCCSDHGIVFHNTQRYRWISSLKCFHTHTQQPPECKHPGIIFLLVKLSDHTCVQMSYKGGRVSFSGPWTTCTYIANHVPTILSKTQAHIKQEWLTRYTWTKHTSCLTKAISNRLKLMYSFNKLENYKIL